MLKIYLLFHLTVKDLCYWTMFFRLNYYFEVSEQNLTRNMSKLSVYPFC